MFNKPPPKKPPKPARRSGGFRRFRTVRQPRTAVEVVASLLRKVGTAIIGGTFTGNPRGDQAFDIQQSRTSALQVASGQSAVALGRRNRASGAQSIALGDYNAVTGAGALGIGTGNQVGGANAMALGTSGSAAGIDAIALGNTNTASNYRAVAVGRSNAASGSQALAVGDSNTVSGDQALGLGVLCQALAGGAYAAGFECEARNIYSSALGQSSIADADGATALGYQARASVPYTTNLCGPLIARRGASETAANWFARLGSAEIFILSCNVDLTYATTYTLTLPAGCKFWCNEVGLLCTAVTGLVTQPTITLTPGKTSGRTTNLTAAGRRDRWLSDSQNTGYTTLSFQVASGAVATSMAGRAYWQGILIQDE